MTSLILLAVIILAIVVVGFIALRSGEGSPLELLGAVVGAVVLIALVCGLLTGFPGLSNNQPENQASTEVSVTQIGIGQWAWVDASIDQSESTDYSGLMQTLCLVGGIIIISGLGILLVLANR